jgi:hypothetical protein
MKKVLSFDEKGATDIIDDYAEDSSGGFFKYYELEQYENILEKVSYSGNQSPDSEEWVEYLFIPDKKLLERVDLDEDSKVDIIEVYDDVDGVETMSLFLGKEIDTVRKDGTVRFEDGNEVNPQRLDIQETKELLNW